METTPGLQARLRHNESVVAEEIDDDVSLYLSTTNDVLVLNRTAGDVWSLADGDLSGDEIVQLLAKAYETAPESISQDVSRVLDDLTGRGFLVPA